MSTSPIPFLGAIPWTVELQEEGWVRIRPNGEQMILEQMSFPFTEGTVLLYPGGSQQPNPEPIFAIHPMPFLSRSLSQEICSDAEANTVPLALARYLTGQIRKEASYSVRKGEFLNWMRLTTVDRAAANDRIRWMFDRPRHTMADLSYRIFEPDPIPLLVDGKKVLTLIRCLEPGVFWPNLSFLWMLASPLTSPGMSWECQKILMDRLSLESPELYQKSCDLGALCHAALEDNTTFFAKEDRIRQFRLKKFTHPQVLFQQLSLDQQIKVLRFCEHRFGIGSQGNELFIRVIRDIETRLFRVLRELAGRWRQATRKLRPQGMSPLDTQRLLQLQNTGVTIVTGEGGTGKTRFIGLIAAMVLQNMSYRSGQIVNDVDFRVVSFTNLATENLRSRMDKVFRELGLTQRFEDLLRRTSTGHVLTMHKLVHRLDTQWKNAQSDDRARAMHRASRKKIKILVVDEATMVSSPLMLETLERLTDINTGGDLLHLVIVGDDKQLPPVQWGPFFHQLLEARKQEWWGEHVGLIELKKNYRTSSPDLLDFIQGVRHGRYASELDLPESGESLEIHCLPGSEAAQQIRQRVVEYYRECRADGMPEEEIQGQIQIVTPENAFRKWLNAHISADLAQDQPKLRRNQVYFPGDPVVFKVNGYSDLYNGTMGYIVAVDDVGIGLVYQIRFGEEIYAFPHVPRESYLAEFQIDILEILIDELEKKRFIRGKEADEQFLSRVCNCVSAWTPESPEEDTDLLWDLLVETSKRWRLFTDFQFHSISEVEHAYALTVHGAQGREWKVVIFGQVYWPEERIHGWMTQELAYTGVSRAREYLEVWVSPTTVEGFSRRTEPTNSHLWELMKMPTRRF